MKDFLIEYRPDIIYGSIVIGSVVALRLLTNLLHKWLLKKEREKFPGERPTAVNLIRRVLNALWLVLGLVALSFLFVKEEKYETLEDDFKLIMYLGLLAVLTIVAAASANMWFKQKIKKKIWNNDDPTSLKFLRYVAVSAIYFTGLLFGLLAFPSLRGVAQTALGGAGLLALIAGVSSQEALSNLVGGIFIISFKPFKIGDLIKISDTMVGTVVDITLRHTVIRNFENKMIVIPNAIINKEKLINYDLGELKCCERIEIGISYDSDMGLAKKIMQEECEKHPLIYDNRTPAAKKEGNPIVKTAIMSLEESSIIVRAWAWGRNFSDCFQIRIDVTESIKKRFDAEGVELPFPHRTIIVKEGSGHWGKQNKTE